MIVLELYVNLIQIDIKINNISRPGNPLNYLQSNQLFMLNLRVLLFINLLTLISLMLKQTQSVTYYYGNPIMIQKLVAQAIEAGLVDVKLAIQKEYTFMLRDAKLEKYTVKIKPDILQYFVNYTTPTKVYAFDVNLNKTTWLVEIKRNRTYNVAPISGTEGSSVGAETSTESGVVASNIIEINATKTNVQSANSNSIEKIINTGGAQVTVSEEVRNKITGQLSNVTGSRNETSKAATQTQSNNTGSSLSITAAVTKQETKIQQKKTGAIVNDKKTNTTTLNNISNSNIKANTFLPSNQVISPTTNTQSSIQTITNPTIRNQSKEQITNQSKEQNQTLNNLSGQSNNLSGQPNNLSGKNLINSSKPDTSIQLANNSQTTINQQTTTTTTNQQKTTTNKQMNKTDQQMNKTNQQTNKTIQEMNKTIQETNKKNQSSKNSSKQDSQQKSTIIPDNKSDLKSNQSVTNQKPLTIPNTIRNTPPSQKSISISNHLTISNPPADSYRPSSTTITTSFIANDKTQSNLPTQQYSMNSVNQILSNPPITDTLNVPAGAIKLN